MSAGKAGRNGNGLAGGKQRQSYRKPDGLKTKRVNSYQWWDAIRADPSLTTEEKLWLNSFGTFARKAEDWRLFKSVTRMAEEYGAGASTIRGYVKAGVAHGYLTPTGVKRGNGMNEYVLTVPVNGGEPQQPAGEVYRRISRGTSPAHQQEPQQPAGEYSIRNTPGRDTASGRSHPAAGSDGVDSSSSPAFGGSSSLVEDGIKVHLAQQTQDGKPTGRWLMFVDSEADLDEDELRHVERIGIAALEDVTGQAINSDMDGACVTGTREQCETWKPRVEAALARLAAEN